MTDKRVNEADQPHADAAALHHQPRENKKGNGEENVIPGPGHHRLRQHDKRRRAARPEIGGGGEQQHEADRHAGEYRHEKQDQRGVDARNPRLRLAQFCFDISSPQPPSLTGTAAATISASLPCARQRRSAAHSAISAMPMGSGRAISAAGTCRIGVRSAQLAATNSIETTAISPLTKKTTTSASARQTRSTRLGRG